LLVLGIFLRTNSKSEADGRLRRTSQVDESQSAGALRIRFSMAMENSSAIAFNRRKLCRGQRTYSPTRNDPDSDCRVHTTSPARIGMHGNRLLGSRDRGYLVGVQSTEDQTRKCACSRKLVGDDDQVFVEYPALRDHLRSLRCRAQWCRVGYQPSGRLLRWFPANRAAHARLLPCNRSQVQFDASARETRSAAALTGSREILRSQVLVF